MKSLKKIIAGLALSVTLFTAVPAPQAQAGLILLPTGVGVVILIIGAIQNRLGLIILDGSTAVADQIQDSLATKYPFIDDQVALADLAKLIAEKIDVADLSGEQVELKLSRQEILNVLAPTGLATLEAQKVEALISDLE